MNSSRVGLVGLLGGVGGDGAGLLGEFEVRIARQVGGLHGGIAGQHRSDAVFLLAPVDVGDAVAFGRLDQAAQPHLGPKMYRVLLGWQRPVRDRNADRMVRLRPSLPTARSARRMSDRALRSSRIGATAG